MSEQKRFIDQHKRLSDFADEVWAVCPACSGKAIATRYLEEKIARILCTACGYNRSISISLGSSGYVQLSAHDYFNAPLWLSAPFKDETFDAYNSEHLNYLQEYIAAGLRETKDRKFFTMVEKLPKFITSAKNREALLKLIEKLRKK